MSCVFRWRPSRCTSRAGEHGELPPDVAKTKDHGLTSTQDVAYTNDNTMARLHTETIPTSTLAATARVVDGFVTTQSDHQGITGSFTRAHTATGVTQTATDGRGNTTTVHTDLAGRTISITDAAGNSTTTVYDEDFDQPSVVTNAQGKTSCYKYDLRGRKVAEWGTAIQSPRRLVGGLDKCAAFAPKGRGRNGVRPSQPALFSYDDADNLTSLTTFRADSGDITTSVGYATDGRIATAGFMHGGVNRQFSYGYLSGSNLLHTLTQPNGITLTQSYEEHRDLLTDMQYHRGSTLVVERSYSYDTLGRPTNRSTARQGSVKNDTFTHNDRSESARRPRLGRLRQQAVRAIGQTRSVCPEGARSREAAPSQLTAATLGTDAYSYSYDNIGNRKTAQEAAEEATAYDANNLNQYTAIQTGEEAAFVPTFDADGNQTKVQTSTGIWNVVYNAENRPVTFTSEDGATVVECTYDYMGRRHTRKITVNGSVTNYLRYIYRGYLQIAAINAVSGVFQWFILWDPTQSVATRPLDIRKDGTWYTYGWDLTKNICEVFGSDGYIKTAYTYTPYGAVTATGNVTQPIQWSSEYSDSELGLVYYNYRHYNPADGRWTGRDLIVKDDEYNLYVSVLDSPLYRYDILGKETYCCTIILFVDMPMPEAVENNVLNVDEDTGHTWVELHGDGNPIVFSVGPLPGGISSAKDFRDGKCEGVTDWDTESHRATAVQKEWKLTKQQCDKAKKIIQTKKETRFKYTPEYQCTTAALELLNAIPVNPPPLEGRGHVVAKRMGITFWEGIVANPYHLGKQIGGSLSSNQRANKKYK